MKNRTRLWLDAGLFAGMLLAFSPGITGISIHEWLSLAIVVPTLVHLIVNWDWVTRVTARILGRIRTVSKVNLALDAVLFIATVTVMLSGVLVSQAIASAFGLGVSADAIWYAVHSASARITIALLLAHLALHAGWVVRTARSLVPAPQTEVIS